MEVAGNCEQGEPEGLRGMRFLNLEGNSQPLVSPTYCDGVQSASFLRIQLGWAVGTDQHPE